MSAFLTTTMPIFKKNIEAIEAAGLRGRVKILVGGALVTQECPYMNIIYFQGV